MTAQRQPNQKVPTGSAPLMPAAPETPRAENARRLAGDGIGPSNRNVLGRARRFHRERRSCRSRQASRPGRPVAAVRIMGIGELAVCGDARVAISNAAAVDSSVDGVANCAHPCFPTFRGREFGEHSVEVGKVGADIPDVHVGVDIAQADMVPAHPGPAIGELRFDPLQIGAKLVAHLRDRGRHGGNIEFGAAQFLAVGDELLRDLVGERTEDEIHGALEERLVRPHRRRGSETPAAVRKQCRLRETPLQLADDALGVAIDVGPICITGVRR